MTPGGPADSRPYVFLGKYPDEILDYALPPGVAWDPATEETAGVRLVSFPSADGELELSDMRVDTETISVTVTGGQPGRIYTLRYVVVLTTGHEREVVGSLTVARELLIQQPQPLPVREWSPPLIEGAASTWDNGLSLWDGALSLWDEVG